MEENNPFLVTKWVETTTKIYNRVLRSKIKVNMVNISIKLSTRLSLFVLVYFSLKPINFVYFPLKIFTLVASPHNFDPLIDFIYKFYLPQFIIILTFNQIIDFIFISSCWQFPSTFSHGNEGFSKVKLTQAYPLHKNNVHSKQTPNRGWVNKSNYQNQMWK